LVNLDRSMLAKPQFLPPEFSWRGEIMGVDPLTMSSPAAELAHPRIGAIGARHYQQSGIASSDAGGDVFPPR
jgi:hypothetical protein